MVLLIALDELHFMFNMRVWSDKLYECKLISGSKHNRLNYRSFTIELCSFFPIWEKRSDQMTLTIQIGQFAFESYGKSFNDDY